MLSPSLALSVGKPFCIPPASVIPTATSTLSLLRLSNARSLMSVPSILEDLLYLPQSEGVNALRTLDFVAVGGGPIKSTVGAALIEAGVKLLNHMGATEIGAIAPIFLPSPDYHWRYLLLPKDRFGPRGSRRQKRTFETHRETVRMESGVYSAGCTPIQPSGP